MDYYLKYYDLFWVNFFVKHPVYMGTQPKWTKQSKQSSAI